MVKKTVVLLFLAGLLAAVAACSSGESATSQSDLVSLQISPANTSMIVDTDQQFIATGIYSNNSTKDLTASVKWNSSDPTIAVVSNAEPSTSTIAGATSNGTSSAGRTVALAEGTTTIEASYGTVTASAEVKVQKSTLLSITVTPSSPSIARGTSQQFTATGTFENNRTVNLTTTVRWTSSNSSVATISNTAGSNGLAASTGSGMSTITASWGNISDSTILTVKPALLVSIAITPTNPVAAKGTSQQFIATGTYSDNTTQDVTTMVAWTSSHPAIATISNAAGSNGVASALSGGTTTISAASGSISGSTILTVNPATLVSIAVTPTVPAIAKGTGQQFLATGMYSDNTTQDLTAKVAWTSSHTAVATISNAAGSIGLATSVSTGTTTITASSGSLSGSATLTVNPATLVSIALSPDSPSIAKGTSQQFTATGTYSDNSTQNLTAAITWSSSNTTVATISNAAGTNGLAKALASGSTTITATSGAISGTTTLTVNPASLLSLTLAPASASIGKGTTQQYTATGNYSDSTTQNLTASVTWSSSNTAIATISNAAGSHGLATAVSAGSATITAVSGLISGKTTLTVTPAQLTNLSVTPATATVAKGSTQQYAAKGTYSDSTTQILTNEVTWTSSNTGVATISNALGSKGLTTAMATGSSTIKATSGSVSGGTTVTVVDRSAILSWDAPTTNTDGTALTDLAGYNIHYGTASASYGKKISAGNVRTYTISNLAPGTYYFTVTSVNTGGVESNYSNEVSKTVQ